jgi:ATP-dependent Clp protease ATP-binding subunit ClpA
MLLGGGALEGMRRAYTGELRPYGYVEDGLNEAIFGQEEAISSILESLHRKDFRSPDKPIANLLFLGPTGVGKSQTAKELARILQANDQASFLKIDCSAYSQDHTVASLLGAPPGYVGRGQKPVFDPKELEKPCSVVLFDEIEKGSPALCDMLLHIMEDGELMSHAKGKPVSFRNSIIIVTSNVGSSQISQLLEAKAFGFKASDSAVAPSATNEQINAAALAALKEKFRPEFVGRFHQRVVFRSLNDLDLITILAKHNAVANQRHQEYQVELSPPLAHHLVTTADERATFGARPVLRAYESKVESALGKLIGSGSIPANSRIYAMLQHELPAAEQTGEPGEVVFYHKPLMGTQPVAVPSTALEIVRAVPATNVRSSNKRPAINWPKIGGMTAVAVRQIFGEVINPSRA